VTAQGMTVSRRGLRRGFTLLELLMSMVIGLMVIAASTNFAAGALRSSRGTDLRDGLNRDARFAGMAISRDLGDAGVAFESTQQLGSVAARGDTVLAVSVPFLPLMAEVYNMVVPTAPTDPLPPGGTCGSTCIDVVDPNTVPFQLTAGDVALLRVLNERRLVVVTNVAASPVPGAKSVTFSPMDTLFTFPSGFAGGLRLRRSGVIMQKLNVSGWFRDSTTQELRRVDGFTGSGALRSTVVSRGAEAFEARLIFTNGVLAASASGADADTTNDYNKIVSVQVRARLRVEQVDRSVNGGAPLVRNYLWRVSPRNLLYERNRAP
jgi:prepilin-type N-terminal cleavage/methylation domain-containing protein